MPVSAERIVKAVLSTVGVMGLGVVLWAVVKPSEEQLKSLPRYGPRHQAESKQLNALVMETIKEAAQTNENVAQRTWPWHK